MNKNQVLERAEQLNAQIKEFNKKNTELQAKKKMYLERLNKEIQVHNKNYGTNLKNPTDLATEYKKVYAELLAGVHLAEKLLSQKESNKVSLINIEDLEKEGLILSKTLIQEKEEQLKQSDEVGETEVKEENQENQKEEGGIILEPGGGLVSGPEVEGVISEENIEDTTFPDTNFDNFNLDEEGSEGDFGDFGTDYSIEDISKDFKQIVKGVK